MGGDGKASTIVAVKDAKFFVYEVLKTLGTPHNQALLCADVLIEADRKGHFSYGMNILHKIVIDIERERCDAKATPKILKKSLATAWVDGKNGLGPVVAALCMNLALKKAKAYGFGLVAAKCSNNPAIMGYWSEYALKHDCIGFVFTNAPAIMVPAGAKERILGPNPLAFAAGTYNDSFSLDMASTIVSGGIIEVCRRKREPIPKGWAMNQNGAFETDSEIASKKLMLVPLGGTDETSGYKGAGLSMMVDIFCGVLPGANVSPNIEEWSPNLTEPANIGHCFMAINTKNFSMYFKERLQTLLYLVRNCEPFDRTKPMMIPGDQARINTKKVDEQNGIRYSQQQINTCQLIASRLGINVLKCKRSS